MESLIKLFAYLLLVLSISTLDAQKSISYKVGLIYTDNNFQNLKVNGNEEFLAFDSNNRLGLQLKIEYNLLSFLSLKSGTEYLNYKIKFRENSFPWINSQISQGEFDHAINVSEIHIPLDLNFRVDVNKFGELYLGLGFEKRFWIKRKGSIKSTANGEEIEGRVDFRNHFIQKEKWIDFRNYRVRVGVDYPLKENIALFVECTYKNNNLYYFYGGSDNNSGPKSWGNDLLLASNSFVNFSVGLKY